MTICKTAIQSTKLSALDFLEWEAEAIYDIGYVVTWKGKTWIAVEGNIGIEPGTDDAKGVWIAYDPNTIVKAVITGPKNAYGEQAVMLSAEKSTSSISGIVSFKWEVPKEIVPIRLDSSQLEFDAPKVTQATSYSIKVTVTNELGYKNTATVTLKVIPFKPTI